jgi:hypothetical protein
MDTAQHRHTDVSHPVGTPFVSTVTTSPNGKPITWDIPEEKKSMPETTLTGITKPELKVVLRYENNNTSTTETVVDIYGMTRDEFLNEHIKDFLRVCGYYVGVDEVLDIYKEIK